MRPALPRRLQAAVAGQRRGDDAFERAEGGAGRDGIGRVGRDEQSRPVAAAHGAGETGRHLDNKQHLTRSHPMVDLGLIARDRLTSK